jgi:protein TonB
MKKALFIFIVFCFAFNKLGFSQKIKQSKNDTNIYYSNQVESIAHFKYGNDTFNKIFLNNFKLKESSKISRTLNIIFLVIVEKNGSINFFRSKHILNNKYQYLVDIAQNIIKNTKKFIPAKLKGKAVRSYYRFDIHICYNGYVHISHYPEIKYDPSLIIDYIEICDNSMELYDYSDPMPSFPGGQTAFYEYLKSNLKYPNQAKENGVEGRVLINFIVESDGSISDVLLQKSIGYGCDEEAIRLIEQSPPWIPGKINDKPVRVQFILPISFKIDD